MIHEEPFRNDLSWPGRVAAVILGVAMLASAGAPPLPHPTSAPEKLVRQIDVMSRIVDKVLLDSPNFLVHSGET